LSITVTIKPAAQLGGRLAFVEEEMELDSAKFFELS
jgi:hypothetical protein